MVDTASLNVFRRKKQKLCIGTANFGFNYGINKKRSLRIENIKKILSYAKKNKIEYLDTAISYKSAEKKIGKSNIKNFKIISKIHRIPKRIKKIDKWIIKNAKMSCKNLKVKSLYGLLIHDTSELNDKKKSEQIFKAFKYLIKNKIIKKVGLSIYKKEELDLYINQFNFKIVQLPINIFDCRISKSHWLDYLKKKRIQIFARSIFLKGLLLKDKSQIKKRFKIWSKNFEYFENWIRKKKISKEEACIRYVKSFDQIDKIIVGVNNIDQLKKNIKNINKKKLIISNNFCVNDENLLNPQNWK